MGQQRVALIPIQFDAVRDSPLSADPRLPTKAGQEIYVTVWHVMSIVQTLAYWCLSIDAAAFGKYCIF